jgi:hypothetical protein
MRLRRTVVLTALAALTSAFMPATAAVAVTGPYCDPGWTEIRTIQGGYVGAQHHIGSLCLGPGDDRPINLRFNLTDYRLTGQVAVTYHQVTIAPAGYPIHTPIDTVRLAFSPSDTVVSSPTLRGAPGGQTSYIFSLGGSHQFTKTAIDTVTPTIVSVPKTTAEKQAAKKTRDRTTAKAKKVYKAVLKKQKSSKTSRSKKAKKTYLRSVKRAKSAYTKAVAPGTTTINSVTTKEVPDGPPLETSETAAWTYVP